MQFQTPKKKTPQQNFNESKWELYQDKDSFLRDAKRGIVKIDEILIKINLLALHLLNQSSTNQEKDCFDGESVSSIYAEIDHLQTNSPLFNHSLEKPLKFQSIQESPHDYFCDPSPGVHSIDPYQKSQNSLLIHKKKQRVKLSQQEPLLQMYINALNQNEIQQFQCVFSLIEKQKNVGKNIQQIKKLHEIFRKVQLLKSKFIFLIKSQSCQEQMMDENKQNTQQNLKVGIQIFDNFNNTKKKFTKETGKSRSLFLKKFSDKQKLYYASCYLKAPNQPKFLQFIKRIGLSQVKLKSWVKKQDLKAKHQKLVSIIKKIHQQQILKMEKEALCLNADQLVFPRITYLDFRKMAKNIFDKKNFGCNRKWFINFVQKNNLNEICDIQFNADKHQQENSKSKKSIKKRELKINKKQPFEDSEQF